MLKGTGFNKILCDPGFKFAKLFYKILFDGDVYGFCN